MINIQKIDLKEVITQAKDIKGLERGADIHYLINYVKVKEGINGYRRLLDELEKNGYNPPNTEKIKNDDWISCSIPTIYMVAMAKYFFWTTKDLEELGENLITFTPSLARFYIKYLSTLRQAAEKGIKEWQTHFNFGRLELANLDEKNKTLTMRLRDFHLHPVVCYFHAGVMKKIISLNSKSPEVNYKETKCIYNGDPYHEWIYNWK